MFSQLIPQWLDNYESRETRSKYHRLAMRFLESLVKNGFTQELKEMKLTTLQKWRRTLPANLPGLRAYIATVKSLFRFAYNQGYIESNIARCLKVPKIAPIRVERNMSKEQALASIEACSGNDRYKSRSKTSTRTLNSCKLDCAVKGARSGWSH